MPASAGKMEIIAMRITTKARRYIRPCLRLYFPRLFLRPSMSVESPFVIPLVRPFVRPLVSPFVNPLVRPFVIPFVRPMPLTIPLVRPLVMPSWPLPMSMMKPFFRPSGPSPSNEAASSSTSILPISSISRSSSSSRFSCSAFIPS